MQTFLQEFVGTQDVKAKFQPLHASCSDLLHAAAVIIIVVGAIVIIIVAISPSKRFSPTQIHMFVKVAVDRWIGRYQFHPTRFTYLPRCSMTLIYYSLSLSLSLSLSHSLIYSYSISL